MTALTVTDRRPDSVTVAIGPRSATLFRSECVAGLKLVTDKGTCTEFVVIRGLAFNRDELHQCLGEMGTK